MKHRTDDKMTVKDGKFYKGDKLIPAEHGNKEQIALMKRVHEMMDGFDPEITIKKRICMEFTCVCGAHNEFNSFTEIDEDDPNIMIAGEIDSCHYCGLKYKVIVQNTQYSDFLLLKLIQ